MNLSSYLARTAMANTEALGRTEMAKQRMQNELAVKQEEAQGQAIGGLTGALLGAGVGAYQGYQKGQASQDAARGFQARSDYSTLTDNSLPVGARINSVKGPEYAGAVDEETAPRPSVVAPSGMYKGDSLARPASMKPGEANGLLGDAYKKATAQTGDRLSGLANATADLPRLSFTHDLVGETPNGDLGVHVGTVKEVRNSPEADYANLSADAAQKLFLGPNSLYDRSRNFSASRNRRY